MNNYKLYVAFVEVTMIYRELDSLARYIYCELLILIYICDKRSFKFQEKFHVFR